MTDAFGAAEAALAKDLAVREYMHPFAAALTAGHTALAMLDGAQVEGQLGNPSPTSSFIWNAGLDGVGKSR